MNKKFIPLIGAVVIIVLASGPNAFANMQTENDKYNQISDFIGVNVINIDKTNIEIKVNPGDFKFETIDTDKGLFTSVILPGYGFSSTIGQAKLPLIRKMVEIPQDSDPELLVISESWDCVSLDELNMVSDIIPAQMSIEKESGYYKDLNIDKNYYFIDQFSPDSIAKIVDIGEIRSRRFALVEISPVKYNPVSGELKLMNSCEIIINLPNSNFAKTYENIRRYSTPNFEKLFELAFSNYGFYENEISTKSEEGYLIIVYDDFYDEIEPLADWKTSMGYDTTVTKTSEIPGGSTKENIHDYIDDAYNNWEIPPAYVLLVGDTAQVPTYLGTEGPDAVDLYFVTIDSDDYLPDIFIGRLPASQGSHVSAMVDKTIFYEQGNFSDTEWIKKAAFMAGNDNYWITEGTHNYVISNYLEPNSYICDKLYEVTYGANTQDVTDALNEGRSLAIFSGHGSRYNWDDGPHFDQDDVGALTNEGYYPFVCSHACLTGSFQVSECFGETWLREEDKGGIAFWGASESTYWDEDDILEKGMFQAWWDDGLESIGGMTDMALYYVYDYYGGGGASKYYFEAYNILGDPSIKIWRNDPSGSPDRPVKPEGPDFGAVGIEYSFSTSSTDPDGDQLYFIWDWGDGTTSAWMGPYSSGETCVANHSWNEDGNFEVKVKARDEHFSQSDWSESSTIEIVYNYPPEIPEIVGAFRVLPGIAYNFKFSSNEPDGEDVYFYIEWGDGEVEEWIGPYSSGEKITLSHKYTTKGYYLINATAKDINDLESETRQKPVKVSFSRSSFFRNPLIFTIIERLISQLI
ncbi:MAG: hypothetical protein AYK22_09240 [Thermoplasmatales archaeon SG8-52-3]|nr:MAG: hypothetical protein AYK22_09240 [Thermoplasmatales archaeon SG8-52-3]